MNKIKLLDCTLRDGGYINDWNFGQNAIVDIKEELEKSNTEIIELGFIRDEDENCDRSIFTNINEVKSLIANKLPGKKYAVMTEVSNPYPLEKLEPYSEGAPDIIRVIVWKRMLQEGYEYCKGIVEKGYKLCVQPARVSQYSDEEFVDMLKMFSELNPMAIYVVDSWGTMYKDELLHYLKLADENLRPEIAVGYHGHNNLMQAFEVACAFCEQNLSRDLIIDSSVYGIGRGAGNLNSELIAKWMNEKLNKNYDLGCFTRIYDKYVSKIYLEGEKWGYSIPFEITAKYNCNPNYASFYTKNNVSNEMIEEAVKLLTPDERVIFKEDLAINVLKSAMKKGKKICMLIPTCNRHEVIDYLLFKIAKISNDRNLDIVVFDSSNNNKTKDIVDRYAKEFHNVIYDFYPSEKKIASLDKKVIDAYCKYASKYDYVWATRDGLVWNIDEVINNIYDKLEADFDMVVLDDKFRDFKNHGSKIYTDCVEFFTEQAHQMTILGATIVKSDFILNVIKQVPLDEKKNFGIWQPVAFFEYIANKNFKAASWTGVAWFANPFASSSSFWHKKFLWQWGEKWYCAITNLPEIYDCYKDQVLKFELIDCKPFSYAFMLNVRKNHGLKPLQVMQYAKFIPHVSNISVAKIFLLSLIPSYFVSSVRKFITKSLKISLEADYLPNYQLGNYKILAYKKKADINFDNKLAIIIPTHGRAKEIDVHFYTYLEQYLSYGIDVIVYDSSKNFKVKNVVKNWIKKLPEKYANKLMYNKYNGVLDEKSIDKKVISIYKKYENKYDYIWILRDRSGVDLNNCARKIKSYIENNTDIIVVQNKNDDLRRNPKRYYLKPEEFFQDNFNVMTTLGQTIYKISFVNSIIKQETLDNRNYGLYFPIATFNYIANNNFKAGTVSGKIFNYHPSALKGSFWKKRTLWQFVERFYAQLKHLPSVYHSKYRFVLIEWNKRYSLLGYEALLYLRKSNCLSLSDIEKYKDKIPFITSTPVEHFYKIAKMTQKQAYKAIRKRKIIECTNNDKIGRF